MYLKFKCELIIEELDYFFWVWWFMEHMVYSPQLGQLHHKTKVVSNNTQENSPKLYWIIKAKHNDK